MKNKIMVGIVVLCLGLSIVISYTRLRPSSGFEGIKDSDLIWAKCTNAVCKADYQMPKLDYYKFIQENGDPMSVPPLKCNKCGQMTIYKAEKCPKCGKVFFFGKVPNDFQDRCPACGYSHTEELRSSQKNR